jgi:hypothetical protein
MKNMWRRSGIIAAFISGIFLLLTALFPYTLPQVSGFLKNTRVSPKILAEVRIANSGKSEVTIYKKGELFLTRTLEDQSGNTELMSPQEFELTSDKTEIQGKLVVIKPGETVRMKMNIPSSYSRIMEKGEWDMFISFNRTDDSSFNSESMPFTKTAVTEFYLSADASKNE